MKATMKYRIGVVITTRYGRTSRMLIHAIRSVRRAAERNSFACVVVMYDTPIDASTAHIAQKVTRAVDVRVDILTSGINKGFAAAVNDGFMFLHAKYAPDWYVTLNDDAYVHKNFFSHLSKAMKPGVFDAVSCAVVTPEGNVESVGLKYFSTGLAFPRQKIIRPGDTQLVVGTCALFAKERVEKELMHHGYVFNPLFYIYAEDLELSLRILRDGGNIYISNTALVTHRGSQTSKRGSFFQLYHGYRNLILVVFLLWPLREILRKLPLLLIGQCYIIGMSIYKRYFLLYPKIWWWIIKYRLIIRWQRQQYAQK